MLKSVLGPLGEKYKGYGAIEKHYLLVGSALIHPLAKYIDDEWTAEVEKAWVVTHGAVVDMMLKGIENSQARIIALEGLCDEEVYQEEINHARDKLNKIEMNGVNISRANLNKAQLVNAELFYTNLNNINLSEVD